MSGYIEIGTERAVTDAPLIFGTSTAANEIGTECAVTFAAVYSELQQWLFYLEWNVRLHSRLFIRNSNRGYFIWNGMCGYIRGCLFGTPIAVIEIGTECAVTDAPPYHSFRYYYIINQKANAADTINAPTASLPRSHPFGILRNYCSKTLCFDLVNTYSRLLPFRLWSFLRDSCSRCSALFCLIRLFTLANTKWAGCLRSIWCCAEESPDSAWITQKYGLGGLSLTSSTLPMAWSFERRSSLVRCWRSYSLLLRSRSMTPPWPTGTGGKRKAYPPRPMNSRM